MTEPIHPPSPAGRARTPRRSPKRPKRHAAAVSRIAASGIAAASTAALVAVLGARSGSSGNVEGNVYSTPQVPTVAGVALPEQLGYTYTSPLPPVTAAPRATVPVTQSSGS